MFTLSKCTLKINVNIDNLCVTSTCTLTYMPTEHICRADYASHNQTRRGAMALTEFNYTSPFEATDAMKRGFDEKGYVIIRGLLEPDELKKVTRAFEESEYIQANAYSTDDNTGRKTRVACWKQPGDDVTGLVTRSERVVRTCEKLLGGEVFHYHSKINMKDARTGGQFVWHQDYGYWYQNGILFPDMISVFIALDTSVRENGCLQILEGSHKCGRIDHGLVAGQTGADEARVELIKDALPLKYVEMQPGDAVFFHSNVLHTSSPNVSDRRRWVFISCYNKVSNKSVKKHHFPSCGKLDIVCDSAIRSCTNVTDMSGKDFLDPNDNTLIKAAK
ncbi:ectoine dioxygenase-like isoform X1 [Haliotis rufescens]|uniref:ectoine dioxygenase-like isoform X1 n=1 Tax=Haliotis rufescens TaxID=6454 RepID=UPI001EAFD321|nr:ectoine dioxygenase-like isoform X1 [Haliotis rufescens]